MPKSLGTLGELFPDTAITCRIPGCNCLIQVSGEKALRHVAAGEAARPERMCDSCFSKFNTLEDKALRCTNPGCTNTWNWNRFQQLESLVQGNTGEPRGFCDSCRSRRRELKDQSLPCRMKGCKGTVLWTREQQWQDGADHPPSRLCPECAQHMRQLSDREIPCRIRGCTGSWLWNRFQQLETIVAGKNPEDPPKRMCRDCSLKLRSMKDVEVPCKIKGCSRTWTFSAYVQLEFLLNSTADTPPLGRMCPECFRFYESTQDRHIPCRHRGCNGSWNYSRAMQLHDWLENRTPAPRLCDTCSRKIKTTADLHVPCIVPGCTKTWKYPAADQVRDLCLGKVQVPSRRCASCEEFLGTTPPLTIACPRCSQTFSRSSYEQLMSKLGTFTPSDVCSSCIEKELSTQKPAQSPVTRENHIVVKMPANGRWNADPDLLHWPPHLTPDAITAVETADIRIVAIGDDLTWSGEKTENTWPFLLDKRLNDELKDMAIKVAVINAGMPRTTSVQTLQRLARDLNPFEPDLIVFNFAFADAHLELNRHDQTWRSRMTIEQTTEAIQEFCHRLKTVHRRLLYWTPNPILPHDLVDNTLGAEFTGWANAQEAYYDQYTAQVTRICANRNIPVLDLHSRFMINGKKSARKWMSDWHNHNATGAQNIANWMAEYILREKLLPLEILPVIQPAPIVN